MLLRYNKPILLAFFAFLYLLFPLMADQYYLYLAKLAGIGVILALGTNVFFGYCGQINLGASAFYAFGAYFSALLQVKLGLHIVVAFPITLLACLLVALLVGVPVLRLRGHTLALGTIALAKVTHISLNTWIDLTGGEDGLSIPKLSIFGYEGSASLNYYLIWVFALLTYFTCHKLISSRIGLSMKAIRADETAAQVMGVNSFHYRMLAFMLNGVFAGLAGILFAQESGWISPANFNVWTSIVILIMVVVGGTGSNLGSAVGGAIFMLLPQVLGAVQQYHILIYGLFLALALRFMPRGISGFVQENILMRVCSLKEMTGRKG